MNIVVCDDHVVFAESLALVLADAGNAIVAVTNSPEQALEVLRVEPVDVCLLDMTFPSGSVLTWLPELHAAAPDTGLMLLSGFVDPHAVATGLANGVRGFAHKGQHVTEIVAMVGSVHEGNTVVDPALSSRAPAVRQQPRTEVQRLAPFLTPREREVLGCLVRGENTAALAKGLGVSWSTARSHVQSVLTKLGVHSQVEAATVAVRHGLVSIETGEWLLP